MNTLLKCFLRFVRNENVSDKQFVCGHFSRRNIEGVKKELRYRTREEMHV